MGQGQPPVDVTEHLHELLHNIDFAFEQPSSEATPQRERERYAAALAAIGAFLSKIRPAHAGRFFDLSYAFTDLNSGARPPIFRGPKRRSVPNPTQIEAAKAEVAFALDALIALGEKPLTAAQNLLREFKGIENLAGPKSQRAQNLKKTILEWRKSLSATKRRKNELAAELFAAGRELVKFLINKGRTTELRNRARGRAAHAARVGVSVKRSNTP